MFVLIRKLIKNCIINVLISVLLLKWLNAGADTQQFFNSTHGVIPPASMVMSLPTPDESTTDDIWDSIRQNLRLQDQYNRPEVAKWIRWLKNNPKILDQVFRNAKPYLFYVFQQTQRYQMPAEFALLPAVESGYNPYAFSSSGAVGIWQMMPGTAMIYGLDINWWYDGRRDIITSTDRALNFLVSLRETLNDWLLAAAGYDAGGETIQKAIAMRGGQAASFWQLSLSKETEDYVPKLLAVSAIVADPQKYGVTLPYIANKDYFSVIKLNFQLDASEIARLAQVSLFEVQQLNPGMRRWATNPEQQYTLLLPVTKADIFRSNLAQVAGQNHVTWQYHEVHDGQTLESIAANYHTSIELLHKVNDLDSDEVTAGQGLVVPLYLHRKYQNIQMENNNTPSIADNHTESPEAIEKITANQILSGRLNEVSQLEAEQRRADPVNNLQIANPPPPTPPSTPPPSVTTERPSVASVTSTTANLQTSASAQPIQEQDDLRTIVNKLYSSNR